MKKLRFIVSRPANGPLNMALDEVLFDHKINLPETPPCLRIYTWTGPCMTIGYFQKSGDFAAYGIDITRRMTGGLSVVHGNDVSFSFILDENNWEHLYDQEKTYELIHLSIKSALAVCGIQTEFVKIKPDITAKDNICVQTLYPYDLQSNSKKIVGSCQRRRGKTLMVQGSIHLHKTVNRDQFYAAWRNSLTEQFGVEINEDKVLDLEASEADALAKTKYSDPAWNKKY